MQDAGSLDSSFLVGLKNNCNKVCGGWSASTQIDNEIGGTRKYVRLHCKRWNCARCGPKRAKQVRHAIIQRATELDLRRMMTLTIGHGGCTAEQSTTYIRNCWKKFRVYLRRKFGESIQYICITEFQKNGYAHLHILVDRYIHFEWIQDNWQAVGGGYRVRIEPVDIHRIGPYLSKYLTKDLFLSPNYGKYRRFTTSKGLKLIPKPIKGLWQMLKTDLDYLFDSLAGHKLDVVCDQDGRLQAFAVALPLGSGP